MQGVGWIAGIIIGAGVGVLAEMFMKSNMGVLMNIILGVVMFGVALDLKVEDFQRLLRWILM